MRIKRAFILLLLLTVALLFGCSEKPEIRTDIEPLIKYLPDMGITEAAWYGGTKDDMFSGVGPATYIIYGTAKVGEEFLSEIESKYCWSEVEQDIIFDFLKSKAISDYLDEEENYVFSQDFCDDIANTYKFDVLVNFEKESIVFYWEYINF